MHSVSGRDGSGRGLWAREKTGVELQEEERAEKVFGQEFEFIEAVGIEQTVTHKVAHQGQYPSGG